MSIYKACDIRGHYGVDLTLDHAVRLGQAIGQLKGPVRVVVGGDGRLSSPALREALVHSLLASGCDVVDLGLVSTPMFYFARAHLGLEVGAMVTASHNPARDNGFKLTLGSLPVSEEDMRALAEVMEQPAPNHFGMNPGRLEQVDILPAYLDFARAHAPNLSGMTVVVDCASGAGALAARKVWESTGASLAFLLEEVDGRFPAHAPNPAEPKNLALLRDRVRAMRADLGVAYDGDGDRAAFVDEHGRAVSGDQSIVLYARGVLADGHQTIVYDQKCSRVVPEMIRRMGGTPVMERSGHTHIKRAYMRLDAAYAGELSGHHFIRPYGDDALVSSLFFTGLVQSTGMSLGQIVAQIPAYATTPDIRLPMEDGQVREVLTLVEQQLAEEAKIDRLDGLRVEYPDAWALLRPSVTEPVITMRFEGDTPAALERMIRRIEVCAPALRGKLGF